MHLVFNTHGPCASSTSEYVQDVQTFPGVASNRRRVANARGKRSGESEIKSVFANDFKRPIDGRSMTGPWFTRRSHVVMAPCDRKGKRRQCDRGVASCASEPSGDFDVSKTTRCRRPVHLDGGSSGNLLRGYCCEASLYGRARSKGRLTCGRQPMTRKENARRTIYRRVCRMRRRSKTRTREPAHRQTRPENGVNTTGKLLTITRLPDKGAGDWRTRRPPSSPGPLSATPDDISSGRRTLAPEPKNHRRRLFRAFSASTEVRSSVNSILLTISPQPPIYSTPRSGAQKCFSSFSFRRHPANMRERQTKNV